MQSKNWYLAFSEAIISICYVLWIIIGPLRSGNGANPICYECYSTEPTGRNKISQPEFERKHFIIDMLLLKQCAPSTLAKKTFQWHKSKFEY